MNMAKARHWLRQITTKPINRLWLKRAA